MQFNSTVVIPGVLDKSQFAGMYYGPKMRAENNGREKDIGFFALLEYGRVQTIGSVNGPLLNGYVEIECSCHHGS